MTTERIQDGVLDKIDPELDRQLKSAEKSSLEKVGHIVRECIVSSIEFGEADEFVRGYVEAVKGDFADDYLIKLMQELGERYERSHSVFERVWSNGSEGLTEDQKKYIDGFKRKSHAITAMLLTSEEDSFYYMPVSVYEALNAIPEEEHESFLQEIRGVVSF